MYSNVLKRAISAIFRKANRLKSALNNVLDLSAPAAYYFLDTWLQDYQYRTNLSWLIFAASGFGALEITLATVSFQCIKAALLDPVKSLRSEQKKRGKC